LWAHWLGPGTLIKHEGHSGFTIGAAPAGVGFGSLTAGLATWLKPTVNPDVILLMIGTNDMTRDVDVAGAPGRMDQLISLISNPATGLKPAALIVASIPPIDDVHNQYRSKPETIPPTRDGIQRAPPGIVAHQAAGTVYFSI
jgi:lysophospholipase L1-like esterase